MTGGGEEGVTLEYTPTRVVVSVCTGIVGISLFVEHFLHYSGKYLKRKHQNLSLKLCRKPKKVPCVHRRVYGACAPPVVSVR